jgi:hypothetical protein
MRKTLLMCGSERFHGHYPHNESARDWRGVDEFALASSALSWRYRVCSNIDRIKIVGNGTSEIIAIVSGLICLLC